MKILQKTLFTFLLLGLGILFTSLQAQVTVKGLVEDTSGEPLIGASIQEKGTKNGAISDIDGKFSLSVTNANATLIISYIGYTPQEVNIKGREHLTVVMQTSIENELNEVVVVGYGTQKKETLTGAISIVGGDALRERPVPSMSNALQGTMPGVSVQQLSGEPGADGGTIRIRGLGSINSSSNPLVLVDGVEMDINQVDMNAVQSISVLKDASSASIYGSRASNGVILITTKKGQQGKMKIGFNSYLTIQTPTNMPKVVGAAEYLQAELDSWDNAGINVQESTRLAREELIKQYIDYVPDNWNRYDTDWKDATLSKTALMQNYNLTLSGGSENLLYFGSLSYLDQGGLIENNAYNRVNLRVNTESTILPWLKLGNTISYMNSKREEPGLGTPKQIINQSLLLLPTISGVKDIDGNWGYGKNGDNPTAFAKDSGLKTYKIPEILLSATLTATPLKNLELQAQYTYKKTQNRDRLLVTPYKTSIRGIEQGYYPRNRGAELTESLNERIKNYFRLQGSYALQASGHNAKALFGFDAEDNKNTNIRAFKDELYFNNYYLDNGMGTGSTSGGAYTWAMASFYGRLNYDYDNKYMLELSGRYDGSSRFMSSNRWGFFPSASAGWILSSEPFMQPLKGKVDYLKLRASYGTLGNQEIDSYYPYTAMLSSGSNYWFDKSLSSGLSQKDLSNRDIKWEKSEQLDIGVDAFFLNQKFDFSFDFYVKNIKDMLMKYPIPYYAGMSPAFTNAGNMRNVGWEMKLTYRETIGNVNFSVTGTLNDNRNKITKLYGAFSDLSVKEGYAYGSFWGYKTDGYFRDWDDVKNSPTLSSAARPGFIKYQKVDPNTDPKQIGIGDKVHLGDPQPHFEYGLNLGANWNNFDFTVFLQGVGKRDVFMSGVGLKPFASGSNLFTHQRDSWTPENQNAEYPILVPESNSSDNFVLSDKWVKSGAYLRLKNVVVGYTIPNSYLSKIKLSSARVYCSAQNLVTFSSFYKGYDPEVNYGGTLGGQFYPIMQTFTFGIDFKF